jgi:hypothetical protein
MEIAGVQSLLCVVRDSPCCTGAGMLTKAERLKLVVDCERLQNVDHVARTHGVSKDTVHQGGS